jgi:FkbM family methyltransferase
MDISIPPYLELLIAGAYVSHDPEVRLTKWLIRNLKEGMTFIDAGAHYGYYTVLAADRVGHTGKVIAIEPSTIVLPYTRRNVARQNNATLIEAGLSDTVGEATFYESDMQYSVISTMNPENLDQIDHLGGIAREITIATTTLDALNVKADIIKLDIEGAETAALRGGATMIQKNKPAIALEVFLRPTDNDRSAVEQLKHYGYSMYAITDTGLVEQIAYDDLDTYLAKRKAAYEAVCDDAIIDNLIFTI